MSQLSQGSNRSLEMMSQETMNQIFQDVEGMFPNQQELHRVQSEYYLAPLAVQLSEGDLHENVELRLDCVGLMRPEGDLPSLSQDQSFRSEVKREPVDPYFQPSVLATPPPEQPIPQPMIVSNTDFPGQYGFDIGFEPEKAPPTKSARWTYSVMLEKLFVKMRCIVPIRIKLHSGFSPVGLVVRVVVIFRRPEQYREIVERCPNHISQHKDGHHHPKHIIRCENPATKYATCSETGRHSFVIPLSPPQAGADFVQEMFQFMCLSSCPGGVNRRPILVVFTLEYGSRVLGRKVLDVRICACPGRDRTIEETKQSNSEAVAAPTAESPTQPALTSTPNDTTRPPTPTALTAPSTPTEEPSTSTGADEVSETFVPKLAKKRSRAFITSGVEVRALSVDRNRLKRLKRQEDEEIFTIQVKGREKFEMLLKIKESLDLMDMVPEALVDNYRASCPPCGKWSNSQTLQTSDSQHSTNSQPDDVDGAHEPISQLSRSDSGSSYQSPTSSQQSAGGGGTEVSAVRFTLRRTVSLEKKEKQQRPEGY